MPVLNVMPVMDKFEQMANACGSNAREANPDGHGHRHLLKSQKASDRTPLVQM